MSGSSRRSPAPTARFRRVSTRLGRRLPHRVGLLPSSPKLSIFLRGPCKHFQLCRVLRPSRRPAAQPGAGGTAHGPAAARRRWAQVDRIVTDQAPWVPIFNQAPTTFASARIGTSRNPRSMDRGSTRSGSGRAHLHSARLRFIPRPARPAAHPSTRPIGAAHTGHRTRSPRSRGYADCGPAESPPPAQPTMARTG
jgi:hypothetical protein